MSPVPTSTVNDGAGRGEQGAQGPGPGPAAPPAGGARALPGDALDFAAKVCGWWRWRDGKMDVGPD